MRQILLLVFSFFEILISSKGSHINTRGIDFLKYPNPGIDYSDFGRMLPLQ
jgi:hypothetical protein